MTAGWRARCPAKVNLFLEVLGRRSDGDHEVRTLYQTIDLWDTLDARPDRDLSMTCSDPSIPTNEDNLVIRAARSFRERLGEPAGARFHLVKGIPSGGGLGGGSSDAAGALLLLAALAGREVPRETLASIAAGVGADVTFFLTGGTALGTGRGERILAVDDPGPLELLVGTPRFGLSTAEIYRRFAATREAELPLTPPANDVSLTRLAAHKLLGGNNFGSVSNDLEAVVFDVRPELAAFRDALQEAGAVRAIVSGSGSSVFGIFPDAANAEEARERLQRSFESWTLRVCVTVPDAVRVERADAIEEGGS